MKMTVLQYDEVDLIISDQSRDADNIVQRLRNENIFRECYYIKTKELTRHKNGIASQIGDLYSGIFGSEIYKNLSESYDELLIHNVDIASYSLYSNLMKKNNSLTCSRFEEGIISYRNIEAYSKKNELIKKFHKFSFGKSLEDSIRCFYCFFPEFYNGRYNPVSIPQIDTESEIKDILFRLFNVSVSSEEYNARFIYFTSVYDFEGGKAIGEFDLICRIAEVVGKDNLLIKMHPRDSRGFYEKSGFKIDQNSAIPWEVLQLCIDCSKKVLLSTNSTSIVSTNLMTEKGAEAFFTYNLCDFSENSAAKKTISIIDALLSDSNMKKRLSRIHIASDISELMQYL